MARSSAAYRSKTKEAKQQRELDLQGRIEKIALEFSGYGYRRVTAQLHREGIKVNHKVVLRLMRTSGLSIKKRRRFIQTTDSQHTQRIYPNLYQNQKPNAPNQIWLADLTYIRLQREFIFLAVILDAFSRRVIGWALSKSLETELTVTALKQALKHRQLTAGCLHHSDRGVQYASTEYTNLLTQNGFQISMSRKANPYDNATMESFFKTLKTEEVYLTEYRDEQEAQQKIKHFLQQVYNQKRLHSALGYQPPTEFEVQYKQQNIPL